MQCLLDLEFMATQKGGLAKLRADCLKLQAKFKSEKIKSHYAAIIAAIDAKES